MDFVKAPSKVREADLERMIAEYGDGIFRMCFVYLQDMSLAEDAMQETFVKVYRQYASFRGESSEKTWIMRVAINTCKDMRRTTWFRQVDRSVALDRAPEPYDEWDPSDDALITEIMMLPAKLKDVVLLKYYQGLSFQEIAQALQIPVGTVSTRINTAKKKLRAALERWYFDD
ncbi:MAG: RNA polymerase sigma factor [Candidatus Limiplasma sp.]|nr:RNA polymerase sigma factor [Candidatus Limiplasma sp.]